MIMHLLLISENEFFIQMKHDWQDKIHGTAHQQYVEYVYFYYYLSHAMYSLL